MHTGLSSAEARQKQDVHGYNELPTAKPKNIFRIAVEVMKEPMFLLLLSCGGLYILLGESREGIILLSSILLIIAITFLQYRKTERALDALKKLASPRVLVIRDGEEIRIPGREVVPDDIIVVQEGDRIPADARVIESVNLSIDESLLTGESMPVMKTSEAGGCDIYGGTLVLQGKGIAQVTKTGIHAQLGRISTSLESIEESETRLQKEMKILIRRLGYGGIFISASVVVLFYFTRGNFIQSLLNGLSASIAILPEEFPVVLTVFLALGAWRLSKKNVLTRRPSAIETLGSATILCSDKTGTITQNKMAVMAIYNGQTITEKKIFSENRSSITAVISNAHQATRIDTIDPMEIAIQDVHGDLLPEPAPALQFSREYPLSKSLLAMTRVHEKDEGGPLIVSAKGAPEAIFGMCRLGTDEMAVHMQAVHSMAEKGYRVLGVAAATHTDSDLPDDQRDFRFDFLGLIGLEDPIRAEVPGAIKECTEAGVKVIMITGDFPATAKSIGTQCGLPEGDIITGDVLMQMTDEELARKIKHTSIFARVIPEQKLRIVQALKANGEIVAMTGDGVNDAPALKAAHIGVAMGNKGTDVAREASSLVLLDDNFASIVAAIRLGRKIFDNLQKAMSYILAIHIPIIGLTLLPAFFNALPLLLMPIHIVFMELIVDPICSIAFESEQEEKDIMRRKPRKPDEKFFGGRLMAYSIVKGLLLLMLVLSVYFLTINEGHTDGEIRAIAFSALIIGNIVLILTSLSSSRSFVSVVTEKNIPLHSILITASIILYLVISVPVLQQVFSFGFPGYTHFIPALAGALLLLFLLELIKYIRFRNALLQSIFTLNKK